MGAQMFCPWVADMDFEIMPEVTGHFERTAHAAYGYPCPRIHITEHSDPDSAA